MSGQPSATMQMPMRRVIPFAAVALVGGLLLVRGILSLGRPGARSASIVVGDPIIAYGQLRTNEYTSRDGAERADLEMRASAVGSAT